MKKKAFREATTATVVNGFVLRSFTWNIHDPDNINTARLTAIYDLAEIGEDGRASPSLLPGHRGCVVELYNVGDNQALTDWLMASGTPGDLLSFDYHDVERLVEADAARRFGLASIGKKD